MSKNREGGGEEEENRWVYTQLMHSILQSNPIFFIFLEAIQYDTKYNKLYKKIPRYVLEVTTDGTSITLYCRHTQCIGVGSFYTDIFSIRSFNKCLHIQCTVPYRV